MLDKLINYLLELLWAGSCVVLARGCVVRAEFTGTHVNSAVTSYEQRHQVFLAFISAH